MKLPKKFRVTDVMIIQNNPSRISFYVAVEDAPFGQEDIIDIRFGNQVLNVLVISKELVCVNRYYVRGLIVNDLRRQREEVIDGS